MISARRAREADLDKAFSHVDEGGRNLSAVSGTFQRHVAPSTTGARDDLVFRDRGCKPASFQRTG
jgi:hypothetical protein